MALIGRSCLAVLLLAATLACAGCGSKSGTSSNGPSTTTATTSVGHLPTAKFALHAGLAFGAFHRYIYKPFKAGTLSGGGLLKHKLTIVKAALAGLFAYHELKLAVADAKASPIISKLLTPVNALIARLAALGSSLKGGHVDGNALSSAGSEVTGLERQARSSGLSIPEVIPGAAQLATG